MYKIRGQKSVERRMVVRLRLARFGRKHRPTYRIVAADARSPRDGRHIEKIGSYDPHPRPDGSKELRLKMDRVKYWLSVGAQPTKRVEKLLGLAAVIPEAPFRRTTVRHIPKAMRKQEFSTYTAGQQRISFHATCSDSVGIDGVAVMGTGRTWLPIHSPIINLPRGFLAK